MSFFKNFIRKSVLPGLIFLLSYTAANAQSGQQLFASNCQSCHNLYKDGTGPALLGVEGRGPWAEKGRSELHKWVRNPPAYIPTSPYTQGLYSQFKSYMTAFTPGVLSDKDIDAIFDYIKAAPPTPPSATPTSSSGDNSGDSGDSTSSLLFGIISLVLAVFALILMQVNSNLKKLSDDKEQISRPDPVPFYRNKVYIALIAVLLFIVGGYFVAKGAINLGRQKGYQPVTAAPGKVNTPEFLPSMFV
jgi:cytochrome c553